MEISSSEVNELHKDVLTQPNQETHFSRHVGIYAAIKRTDVIVPNNYLYLLNMSSD